MTWPPELEQEWQLFISDLAASDGQFFLLVYDRQFTFEALLRRLQAEAETRGWRLVRAAVSNRLVTYIGEQLQQGPVKAVWLQLSAETGPSQLRALNLVRENLYDLPANILFLAQADVNRQLMTTAHDLVTWVKLPYEFSFPRTAVPDLPPAPATAAAADTGTQIAYYRDRVAALVEAGQPDAAFPLLPPLADLYLDAEMFAAAAALYQALIEYYQTGGHEQEAGRYREKLDTATGWRILAHLNVGQVTLDERQKLQAFIEDGFLTLEERDSGLAVVDNAGRAKPISVELAVRLGLISEKAQRDIADLNRQAPEPTLLLFDAEQAYTYTARRYGVGYDTLHIRWQVAEDGGAELTREVALEAYSAVDDLDTYLLIPEESPGPRQRQIGFKSLESLSPDRTVRLQESRTEQDIRRRSVKIVFSPKLDRGAHARYRMVELLSAGLYAVNLSPAELARRKTPHDYCGWNINRPTRRVTLEVAFPPGLRPERYATVVRYAATGGFPADRVHYDEQSRLKGPMLEEPERGRFRLRLEVDYPLVGLIYIIRWQPVPRTGA